ncbi:MAG: biotin transporter BioY [Trueperaceae bacterium]|nr:biotin transporter BioY [Trueperaceae bacterium]
MLDVRSSAPTGLLVDRLVPVRSPALRIAVQVVIGVAFLAALAQVRVQVGPVPITGQTLGVLLLGAAYGATLGLGTTLAYLLAGAAGLAVFSGGGAGLSTLLGPTGGYLLGFPLAALLVGALAARGWDRWIGSAALAMVAGNVVIYTFGLAWLSRFAPDLPTTLAWGLWPFLAGDAVKIVAAAGMLPLAWRLLGRR